MLPVAPATGQFSDVWSADNLQIGQHTNLFAHWEGRAAIDGLFLELPPGWTLVEVVALRHGYEPVPMRLRHMERDGNLYVVSAPQPLRGAHEFILQVRTGGLQGRAAWTLVPFVRRDDKGHVRLIPREGYRVARSARQVSPVTDLTNRVLAFRGDGPPWLLRRAALPDLDTRAAFTIEFWMRTTDLNEVILSTWNGEARSAYPLELIVDVAGRLRYYRSQAEQHVSMATEVPVADGQWHHVALTHNPDAGWTRLFLDGFAADSLYSPVPPAIAPRSGLALGARIPAREAAPTIGGYTGLLDELRIWPRARPSAEIRRTMRQPLETAGDGIVLLNFEEAFPELLVEQRSARTEQVFSDLTFYYPVRNVQAVGEGEGVLLTWETKDPHTTSFIVERSTDGRSFETVGEVAGPGNDEAAREDKDEFFEFKDADVSTQVVFYRIRQRFEGGSERLSGTIKLGLGREEEEEGAFLVGNFPNPFNPNTTIVYEVREAQRVRISVWDLSGQLVAVLIDRGHQPGNFEVGFEGSDLPSGTYFVRLQSKYSPMLTHKMILMK